MRGSKSEPGVIPLAVYDLFDIIHQVLVLVDPLTACCYSFTLNSRFVHFVVGVRVKTIRLLGQLIAWPIGHYQEMCIKEEYS